MVDIYSFSSKKSRIDKKKGHSIITFIILMQQQIKAIHYDNLVFLLDSKFLNNIDQGFKIYKYINDFLKKD